MFIYLVGSIYSRVEGSIRGASFIGVAIWECPKMGYLVVGCLE